MIYAFGPVYLKTVKLPCQQQFQRIAVASFLFFLLFFFYLNGFGLIDRCVIWMNDPPFHFICSCENDYDEKSAFANSKSR